MPVRLIVASSLLLLAAGCDRTPPDPHAMRPDDAAVTSAGRKVYEQHCAACHGARLQGQPNWRLRDAAGRLPAPPHDASGHTWHHPDEVLFRITKYGVARAANLKDYDSAMPAYEGVLGDAEIVAALSWIQSQWPPEIRKAQREVDAAHRANAAKP
ncbi:MAG TPA: c-type cytochrome [Ramlibacter sp.]|uniref:c-type cytochrome n=1 Tax=Ramlibacter sp. TaxID=1917967 RepID=UPI002ED18F1F